MRTSVAVFLLASLLVPALAGCSHPAAPAAAPAASPVTREAIRFDTEAGPILVMLYPEAAPKTVQLMKDYVHEGYYVDRIFERIVPGHVIQVADQENGATEDARRVPLETSPAYHFSAGAAGIARDVDPNSGGPEIFFMDYGTSHLDGNYTVWGQVVQGMDVVHSIARRTAVEAPRLPTGVPNPFPFDRMAAVPVHITKTTLQSITLSAPAAAQYPLQVARNVRVGDYRHSLDYPANLAVGQTSRMVWYVRPYNGSPVPAADQVRIVVGGQTMAVSGDPLADGAFSMLWTPTGSGATTLRFTVAGVEWAALQANVA